MDRLKSWEKYPGQVPMTPFEHMLNDQEIASVLTYVRNSFGNKASAVEPAQVSKILAKLKALWDFILQMLCLKSIAQIIF